MKAVQTQSYDVVSTTLQDPTITHVSFQERRLIVAVAPLIDSWRYQLVKRAFDLLGATLLLAVVAVPSALIAACVALTSKGGVFYREDRVGQNGRNFRIWKFRTMRTGTTQPVRVEGTRTSGVVLEWRMQKHLSDPRITIIGGFLRRWSLDELPQLINVLQGNMSLIGPRPIVQAETAFYGNRLRYYLAAKPGLSGLWQVSGRSNVGYQHRAWLDELYVRSWSLRSDWNILFRTFPAVLQRVGAY